MRAGDLRKALEEILRLARAGESERVIGTAQATLHALEGEPLLTTTEAAALLGIRSRNTVKALVRRLGLRYERNGNRMMIPLAELERVRESAEVRGIRASDAAHEAMVGLATDEPLSADELDALDAGRPGRTPWQRADDAGDAHDTSGKRADRAGAV